MPYAGAHRMSILLDALQADPRIGSHLVHEDGGRLVGLAQS